MKQKDLIYRRDWDVIIILDACRYDVFKEMYPSLNPRPVFSSGSCTPIWFVNTFTEPMKDVIYVSGNPYVRRGKVETCGVTYYPEKLFYKVINAWDKGWRKINGIYTVDPKYVTYLGKLTWSLYPKHKIIIHYLQPHGPYPLCRHPDIRACFSDNVEGPEINLWFKLREGAISKEKVLECYKGNLNFVMNEVFKLLNFFKGRKVIITSDHAECFGEYGVWGHPCDKINDVIRKVPWVLITPQ